MPIYEYHCAKCEAEFEVEQRITEDPIKTCPRCKSRRVKRLISQTSFALKGGGWYADGYGSNGGKSGAAKSESTSASATSDAGSASTGGGDASDSGKSKDSGSSKAKGSKAVA